MDEISPIEQWHNLVHFAVRNDIPVLRVTPAQHRAIMHLPWSRGTNPYEPPRGERPPTLFGHPIDEVAAGLDLATAVERASLDQARIRPEAE